ncbi:MAG: hypothetical protein AAGH68_11930 [Pseudomonadota bacterium]
MVGPGLKEASARFLPHADPALLDEGARNLLLGCAELSAGQRVAILHEDPALGWYDLAAPRAVAKVAQDLGGYTTIVEVGGPGTFLSPSARAATAAANIEIWFARIGDQDRFAAREPGRTTLVSYARTAEALASGFGTRPHAEMVDLKHRIDTVLAKAKSIEVTCPLGTHLRGNQMGAEPEDVTVRRFPMCVPRPVKANSFSGRVALTGFLSPTGSRSYTPASLPIPGVVLAQIENGKIMDFEGDAWTVERIRQHYDHVASLFGIAPQSVHSWHPGLHDGCVFHKPASDDPDLWSNSVFGSPRWLHFHTCGDYAPGEICWMVAEPTVTADDKDIWRAGRLVPDAAFGLED